MSEGRFTGEYDIVPPMKKAETGLILDDSSTYRHHYVDAEKSSPVLTMTGTDPRPDTDYDPEQLKMGIKIEMEHTKDNVISEKIAKDHLDEDARYYTHLIEMEEKHKNDEVKGRL